MTSSTLYKELNYVNHSRERRHYYAQIIVGNPELMSDLLDILFRVDDDLSCRAGWLLEYAIKSDIALLYPYLDRFVAQINSVYKDAAVRPVSKICEILALSYYKKQNPHTQEFLKSEHRSKLIEVAFDWLITDQKVAVKAYTMTTLLYLGTELDWVHPELERIMDEGYLKGSAAFKARVRQTKVLLKKLNSNLQKKKDDPYD